LEWICDKVWNLTMTMLGSSSHPCLSAKAKEAHGLLEFACEVLDQHDYSHLSDDDTIRYKMLQQAGKHALKFDKLVQSTPRNISVELQSEMLSHFLMHCSYLERSGTDRICGAPERSDFLVCGVVTLSGWML
jgi:hypothetical protein